MVRVFIWIFWLMCLLCLCVAQSRRVLLTPQFGFIASFIPQALFLLFFVDKWDVDFCDETLLTLIGSVTLFFVVSLFCAWFYMRSHNINDRHRRSATAVEETIHLSKTVLTLLLVFNVLEIILWLYYVSKATPAGSIVEKFAYMAWVSKFGDLEDKIRFPFFVSQLKVFFDANGYMMLYLLLHSIIFKNKENRFLIISNLACWIANMLFSGNRGPFVILFLMAITQGYFIYGKSKGWRIHIRFKTVFLVCSLGVLIICALYWTLSWFGRDTKQSMVDYLGGYLSAQIKNFDTFIQEGKFGSDFVDSVTFRGVINQFGRLLGKPEWQRNLDLQFRYINGYSLGNCYTALYCYLHDFGYVGLVVFITLMAVISQTVFLKIVYEKKQDTISIMLIVYSYMYQAILLSFLSDRFFSNLFDLTMVRYLLSWWLLRLILTKVRLKRVRVNVSHVDNKYIK